MRFGAISLSIASHLPVMLSSYCNRPVRLPSGRDKLATKPEPIGSATPAKTIGIVLVSGCMAAVAGVDCRDDHVGLQRDQFSREQTGLSARGRKAIVDAQITTFRPSKLLKSLTESREALFHLGIILGEANQHADAPHALRLLRPRSERPRCYRTTEQGYKIAPFHCLPVSQDRASYRLKAAVGKARLMSALGQKQTCAVHKPMSALPLKADMTATNSRAAYPLPQHMIKMLTVGAFGNDMAADPSLVGLAAASSASSDMSHARMVSPLSSQIVSMDRRGSKLSPCPIR